MGAAGATRIGNEQVLIYLVARDQGYAREFARFYSAPLNPIQKALGSLERAGVLGSRAVGTTREYEFNPHYGLRDKLRALLTKALSFYPTGLQDELLITRKRPRRP